jgi:hypothetical protein
VLKFKCDFSYKLEVYSKWLDLQNLCLVFIMIISSLMYKKNQKYKIMTKTASNQRLGPGPVTSGHPPAAAGCRNLRLCKFLFISPAVLFFRMRSSPPGWLQHIPALPRVHLKTSNTHNFWSVAPKIMKFVLTRSLFRDTVV